MIEQRRMQGGWQAPNLTLEANTKELLGRLGHFWRPL